MISSEVSPKELSASQIIDRLTEGWSAAHASLALEFVQRWPIQFQTTVNVRDVEDDRISFFTDLGNIRLRTMDEVPCLLISGTKDLKERLLSFSSKWNSPRYLPFILALSDAAFAVARDTLSNERCLLLSRDNLKHLMRSPDPRLGLKQLLWQQIPRRRLIPYNILAPADGVLFFGRENELNRLAEEDTTSFAIAGPGRIGKTSLVKRYRKLRLQKHNLYASQMFYVSFYQYQTSMDGAARFLAMQIDSSSRSNRIVAKDLLNFLRYRLQLTGRPLDLTLDEVDGVSQSETFEYLGEAARLGYCRLILCGRGPLLKTILKRTSPVAERLELIRLSLLSEQCARELLVGPLTDLGFKFRSSDSVIDETLELSGRLPHHIQLFGTKLAEMAISEKTEIISEDLLAKLKGDFLLAQLFIRTLDETEDPATKLVALKLFEANQTRVTIPFVQELARQEGLVLDRAAANEICIDLTIDTVLAWEGGGYKLANGGLLYYARETGYVRDALSEIRQKMKFRTKAQPVQNAR